MTLKDKITILENFIIRLKNSSDEQRHQVLNNFDTSADLDLGSHELIDDDDILSNDNTSWVNNIKQSNIVIEKAKTGQFEVYGRPFVYIPDYNETEHENPLKRLKKLDFRYFHCPVILKYIAEFFKWQYMEYNLYIYRESFLTDFFKDKDDLKDSLPYCTEELIYAICAHGSLMDIDDDAFLYGGVLYDSPEKFYNKSRYLVFQKLNNDDCNSIPVMQTFLCLAFFDLGRGRTQSAWVLAGIAFRIGIHMGFQLNFQNTNENLNNPRLSEYDLNVKSRIYWGSRLADYYISFALGRSPILEPIHASIPEPKDLPTLPGVEFFIYYDPILKKAKLHNVSQPLTQLNKLYKIVNHYHGLIFKNETGKSNLQISNNLSDFNLKMFEWKDNLGDELFWTKIELRTQGYNPNIMALRYHYYLILLSFNRYFIDKEKMIKNSVSPSEICASVVEDVYNSIFSFKTNHPIRNITLNMVYLCILSIKILQRLPLNVSLPVKAITMVDFFGEILNASSKTWNLAKSAYKLFSPLFRYVSSQPESENESKQEEGFLFGKRRREEMDDDLDESMIPSLNYG